MRPSTNPGRDIPDGAEGAQRTQGGLSLSNGSAHEICLPISAGGRPLTNEAVLRPLATERGVRHRSSLERWYRRRERMILGVTGVALFVVGWQVGSDAGVIDKLFFSSPADIVAAGVAQVQLARFWHDVAVSTSEFVAGAALAVVTAIPLGLIIGWYRRVGYAVDPWLNLFNSLPRIALIPMLVLWLGLGTEPKIAAVFLGGFFSIVVPTAQGVKTVDRQLLDVGRSFRASQRRIFTSIVLPATVPFIVSGTQVAIGRALLGVIVAENFTMTDGLGVMIHKASDNLASDRMLFGVLIFTAAGVGLTHVLGLLDKHVQRWRPSLDVEETK